MGQNWPAKSLKLVQVFIANIDEQNAYYCNIFCEVNMRFACTESLIYQVFFTI